MKRIIAIVLSLVMVSAFSTTAFAAEMWDESAGEGETTITGHIYSSYQISIPATVTLDYYNTQCPVTLTQANIENGYAINVYCTNLTDSAIRLQHMSIPEEGIHCHLTRDDGYGVTNDNPLLVSFTQSDITDSETVKYFSMNYDKMGITGDYSGIMQYSFCCEPVQE